MSRQHKHLCLRNAVALFSKAGRERAKNAAHDSPPAGSQNRTICFFGARRERAPAATITHAAWNTLHARECGRAPRVNAGTNATADGEQQLQHAAADDAAAAAEIAAAAAREAIRRSSSAQRSHVSHRTTHMDVEPFMVPVEDQPAATQVAAAAARFPLCSGV